MKFALHKQIGGNTAFGTEVNRRYAMTAGFDRREGKEKKKLKFTEIGSLPLFTIDVISDVLDCSY